MRMTGRGQVSGPGGRPWLAAVVAVLAACGVAGALPSAAQAGSSQVPDWTQQHPAAHPPADAGAAMAYDAAAGTVVLFGGDGNGVRKFAGTWTWDGTTWAQQHPATHPPALYDATMAYDAATGTVVLFGGAIRNGNEIGDTWTWDGTTWTQQHPATSPPARAEATMAYDAATGTVVLFGGYGTPFGGCCAGDTWTWDGTTWTQQHPATSPPAREQAVMAYDAATSTVILFGGVGQSFRMLGDTWTWDGTTWTQQHPGRHPPARSDAAMAYDAATGNAVLFSGCCWSDDYTFGDTWTWDGATWTRQHPATHPPDRLFSSIAYDAATGNVVLFGGYNNNKKYIIHHDTWTWG